VYLPSGRLATRALSRSSCAESAARAQSLGSSESICTRTPRLVNPIHLKTSFWRNEMARRFAIITSLALVVAFAAACGARVEKEIKSGTVGSLTVQLANDEGVLRHNGGEFIVTFKDSSGKPVDVGAASINFYMPSMGAMAAMNDAAQLTTTSKPGVYRGKVNLQMPGEWQAQITYEGPAGAGKGSFAVTAQ
jgi:hypothetical protein